MVSISEEPFPQAFQIHFQSNFAFVSFNDPVVLAAKYMSGTTLPIICPHTVAAAAPAMPRRNTYMRRKSSTMLVIPASTETSRPRFCFSAVVRKL